VSRSKFRLITLAVVVASVGAAACGSDSDSDSSASSDVVTTEAAVDDTTATTDAASPTSDAASPTTDAATSEPATEPSGEPIKFGVMADTSGNFATTSAVQRAGIEAGVEALNANGGVLGRPVELIVESSGGDPTLAAATVEKLISEGAVAIFGATTSADTIQAKPTIEQAQIPMIAGVAQNPAVTEAPNSSFIFTTTNTVIDASKIIVEGLQAAGIQSVGGITDDTAVSQASFPLYMDAIEEAGIEVVGVETVPAVAEDLTAAVSRLADQDPEVIIELTNEGQTIALLHNTFEQLIPDTQIMTVGPLPSSTDAQEAVDPGALEGTLFASNVDPENPRVAAVAEALGQDPQFMSSYGPVMYDSVMMIAQAITDAGTTDGVAIRDALQTITNYPASWGAEDLTLSFTDTKHVAADYVCGWVLRVFTADNQTGGPWPEAPTSCATEAYHPTAGS
jgi:branched-chain amino acid transport system substrate-binding protein